MLVVCPIYSSTQSFIPNPSLPAESQKADLYGLPHHCPLVSGWVQPMGSTIGRLASASYLFISPHKHCLPASPVLRQWLLFISFPQHQLTLGSSNTILPTFRPPHQYTFLAPSGLGLGMTSAVASPCMLYRHHSNLYFVPTTLLIPW